MKLRLILIAGATATMLAGCANYGVEIGGGPIGVGVSYAAGPPADVDYDGYYDNAYGPIYDGYWSGGAFIYRTSNNDQWRRADRKHFRRDPAPGFNHVHGTAHAKAHDLKPG